MHMLINVVAFNLAWFACVLGAAHGLGWLGPSAVAVVIALHLSLANRPGRELRLVVVAAVTGLVWESLLVRSGLLVYAAPAAVAGVAPLWIVAMWMNFATTWNVSLRWLRNRPLLAVVFGGFGGPLAFYSGAKLGGVVFGNTAPALAIIGLGWAVLTPLLIAYAARHDGFGDPQDVDPGRQVLEVSR